MQATLLRSYTQCELMSVHYKTPVLLIEFEEEKAFSLEVSSLTFRNPITLLKCQFSDRVRDEVVCKTHKQISAQEKTRRPF